MKRLLLLLALLPGCHKIVDLSPNDAFHGEDAEPIDADGADAIWVNIDAAPPDAGLGDAGALPDAAL